MEVAGDAAGGDAAAGAAVRAAGQQVAGADPAEVEVGEGRAVPLTDKKVSSSIKVATKFRGSFTRCAYLCLCFAMLKAPDFTHLNC